MRTIGLLGGMSWESTAEYYRLANEGVRDRLGGLHSARLLLHSVDFAEVGELQRQGRWDDAGQLLGQAAKGLEAAGAELLLICTNTMHQVADQVQAAVVGAAAAHRRHHRGRRPRRRAHPVGLLGTAVHDGAAVLPRAAGARTGSRCWCRTPTTATRCTASSSTSCARAWCATSRARRYRRSHRAARGRGRAGVVLGCTEIELLVGPQDSAVPVFPTTRLHVEAALKAAGV